MFTKILIANRGEIAVRIIRACKEMGISTVAVYSEADRDALHVNLADESYCIGPAMLKDSYLNMTALIDVAVGSGCQAVHPGYGMLSENPKFAKLCEECNLKFIGPDWRIIEKMGNKDEARKTMRAAGVPIVPGIDSIESVEQAKAAADKIGYPVIVKAASGGGGKGIRIVESADALDGAIKTAQAEAKSSFGNGALYMEKFLTNVKHVEMQVLADEQGNIITLGERDCSMQRKNQKLIEESPCTVMPENVRKRMRDVTVKAVKTVGYTNAGTIEYLLDRDNNFYFMEMNTRLQVEHSVTEYVSNIDIVKWQIRIAAGMKLIYKQSDVRLHGCAIECRINSEDYKNNFRPSCGKITLLHIPGGPWVRFDTAIYQDYTIPPFYDSMIGKLVVCARDRNEAIRKMQAALCELVIDGVNTNAELAEAIITDEKFVTGKYYTDTLEAEIEKVKSGEKKMPLGG
ncbi:MAG: acetyl-CoA carboxylase biotin carboxylase subunit [Clostridia bacterium]|nr:acetyl-CoA carboxylase biotin carboxylase subunit [Clostridia bacterium]